METKLCVHLPPLKIHELTMLYQVQQISIAALASFSTLIHPALPPLQVNSIFARLQKERTGGPVGDEIDIVEGAAEFEMKEMEVDDAADVAPSTAQDVVAPIVVESIPIVAAAAVAFPKLFGAVASAFSFSTAPAKTPVDVPVQQAAVQLPAFIEAPATRDSKRVVEEVEEDSDEDDAMPAIVMESDEE